MKMNLNHLMLSTLTIALSTVSVTSYAMQSLSDVEMSEAQGQALLMMSTTAASGSGTGANVTDFNFYKIGMEAKMELNANIKSLQLGCGGVNGVGNCDIDISNLSLSGVADGKIDHTTAINALKAITNRTSIQETQLQALIAEHGTPTWSKGRANTSALLTNPFIEFAIKNEGSAATREIVGFRLSAEEILGHMSAGVVNDRDVSTQKSTGGGINNFSGYLKVSQTPVSASTQPAIFGTRPDQSIAANINLAVVGRKTAQTNVNYMTPGSPGYTAPDGSNNDIFKYNGSAVWGIHVPKQTVDFDFPVTAVTGNRMSQLNLVVRDVPVGTWNASSGTCNDINQSGANCAKRIAIGRDSGGISMSLSTTAAWVDKATFFMGTNTYAQCNATYNPSACSYIANLKANVTVKQNFNLVHNLPITSGGYLSLQSEKVRWPGTASAFVYNTDYKTTGQPMYQDVADDYVPTDTQVMNYGDIAQPGWWLAFKDPLDFGALNPTTGIPMDDVLPQIATYITDYLSNDQNTINIGIGDVLGAAFGAPLRKGLGDIMMAPDARAVMVLENLQLDGHQNIVPNCWGNLKFC